MKIQKPLVIATLLLAISGCENSQGTNSSTPVSPPVSSTPSPELQRSPVTQLGKSCIRIEEPRTDNVFDPSKLQIGSRFMGLTVTKMDASCETNGYNGKYNGTATFQGKIIISGIYDPKYPLEGEGSEGVCFDVVRQDDPRLPRMWGDHRTPWFCFDNPERAKQLFGTKEALLAKIVIDKYRVLHEPKGFFNHATLVSVVDTILIKH